jgi:hypothetical protein
MAEAEAPLPDIRIVPVGPPNGAGSNVVWPLLLSLVRALRPTMTADGPGFMPLPPADAHGRFYDHGDPGGLWWRGVFDEVGRAGGLLKWQPRDAFVARLREQPLRARRPDVVVVWVDFAEFGGGRPVLSGTHADQRKTRELREIAAAYPGRAIFLLTSTPLDSAIAVDVEQAAQFNDLCMTVRRDGPLGPEVDRFRQLVQGALEPGAAAILAGRAGVVQQALHPPEGRGRLLTAAALGTGALALGGLYAYLRKRK